MVPTVKVILWFRRLGNGVGCRRLSVFVFPLRGRENKNLGAPPTYPLKICARSRYMYGFVTGQGICNGNSILDILTTLQVK